MNCSLSTVAGLISAAIALLVAAIAISYFWVAAVPLFIAGVRRIGVVRLDTGNQERTQRLCAMPGGLRQVFDVAGDQHPGPGGRHAFSHIVPGCWNHGSCSARLSVQLVPGVARGVDSSGRRVHGDERAVFVCHHRTHTSWRALERMVLQELHGPARSRLGRWLGDDPGIGIRPFANLPTIHSLFVGSLNRTVSLMLPWPN